LKDITGNGSQQKEEKDKEDEKPAPDGDKPGSNPEEFENEKFWHRFLSKKESICKNKAAPFETALII